METQYGIAISKQALDERFTEKAVDFVKQVLSRLICEQFSDMLYGEEFLNQFNHVRIKDSTTFKVPSNLADHYKGRGHSAGISIQYEFDLKTGKFLDLTLTEAVRNDQTDAGETVENMEKGDLIIRDLGYFSTSVLAKIDKNEAFYLSRLQAATAVYDETGLEIDFKKLRTSMLKNGVEKCEKQVFIGRGRLPVRLIIGLVPPEVYEQRIRRKHKEEKRRGCQMKEKTKYQQQFNLFITNVGAKDLPEEKVMPLYRFRWQIELMFKNWKSVFSIHTLQKMKRERYITMLYIRLILIVINLQIINRLQSALPKQKGEEQVLLSYRKTLQTLKSRFSDILNILRCNEEKAIKILGNIYRMLSKNHWREKRKKRENYCENILLFICIPDK